MARAACIITALALASAMAGPAYAQSDAARARALFDEGVAAAQALRWDDAVAFFRRSGAIVERASTSYNLAVALERLGRLRDAQVALDDYYWLAEPGNARRADADALRARLDERTATLRLTVDPPGASVAIDGTTHEGSGAERTFYLDPGEHVATIEAEDRASAQIQLTARTGQRLTRAVSLARLELGTSVAPSDGALGTLGIGGIVALGVGAGAGIASLATGLLSNETFGDLRAVCGPDRRDCPPGSEAQIESGRALAWSSTLLMIGAALAAAAGVTMLAIDLSSGSTAEGSSGARLEIAPGPGLAGIDVRLRW